MGNAAVSRLLDSGEHGRLRIQRVTDGDPMEWIEEEFSDAETVDLDYESEGYEADLPAHQQHYNKYPRDVTESPQDAAGFGSSRKGVLPGRVKTIRKDKRGRTPPSLMFRQDNHPLYRYDTRGPNEIFREGFRPRSGKLPKSLRLYQAVLHTGSEGTAFVSTSRSPGDYLPDWAILNPAAAAKYGFTGQVAFRYKITAPGGIDLIASLGTTAFHGQQEVIFWKGIRPEFIPEVDVVNGARQVIRTYRNG
jgi:hypothetical protein